MMDNTNSGRWLAVFVLGTLLCLSGCTTSTRTDSYRAWTELKRNTRSAAKATGGMLVSLSELLHLGIKSAVGWTSELTEDPAARYQQLNNPQASVRYIPDPYWTYQRVAGYEIK